jgi:hypothetical protein
MHEIAFKRGNRIERHDVNSCRDRLIVHVVVIAKHCYPHMIAFTS